MKNLMKHTVVGSAVVMTLVAIETLAYAKEKGVSGSWTLSAEGYVLKLVLAQSGTKISGTLQGTHGPMPLKGQTNEPRRSIQGAYIRRDDKQGTNQTARMRPETFARIGALAKYVLNIESQLPVSDRRL